MTEGEQLDLLSIGSAFLEPNEGASARVDHYASFAVNPHQIPSLSAVIATTRAARTQHLHRYTSVATRRRQRMLGCKQDRDDKQRAAQGQGDRRSDSACDIDLHNSTHHLSRERLSAQHSGSAAARSAIRSNRLLDGRYE